MRGAPAEADRGCRSLQVQRSLSGRGVSSGAPLESLTPESLSLLHCTRKIGVPDWVVVQNKTRGRGLYWCTIIVGLPSFAVLLSVCVRAQLVRLSGGTRMLKQALPRKTGSPGEAPDDLSASAARLCKSLWISPRWSTLILRHLGASPSR